MCELPRTVVAEHPVSPATVVLDNARYQRNKVVQGLAAELSIALLNLPSDSPNLNVPVRPARPRQRTDPAGGPAGSGGRIEPPVARQQLRS
jgi:hypothetical protein